MTQLAITIPPIQNHSTPQPSPFLVHCFLHLSLLILLALLITAPGSAQKVRLQLEDYMKLCSISEPQISPDGTSIVFVLSHVNLRDDRHDRDLVLLDIGSRAQRVLTHDRRGLGSPRWSPSGDRIAFEALDVTAKEPHVQVFSLPMSGGEARRITDAPNGVEQFAWRPNGKEIAYVASDDPQNRNQIEQHLDAFEVGDNDYLATSAELPSHIWLVSAEGSNARRLTSGTWSVAKSAPSSPPASPLNWSSDGKFILFTRQEYPPFGDNDLTTIQILNVDTGEIRKLTSQSRFESFGLFSPSGSRVTYLYPEGGDPSNENQVVITPAIGGTGSVVTGSIDRNIIRDIWMPDGNSLLVGAHDRTRASMWLQQIGGEARKLALGDVVPAGLFWMDGFVGNKGDIAFPASTPSHPSELYYLASPDGHPQCLTDFNNTISSLDLGKTESFEWHGPDHFSEDGVLVFPPDFKPGAKFPLVLVLHGGPTLSSTIAFNFLPQLLASHGYLVFEPNYRGSDNSGNAYQRANFDDFGDGPGRDVMAGVEALIKRGFVDQSRIGVSGWSHGGYMTAWLIGHSSIWKAAVAGAPVTDWYDEYNLTDANVAIRYGFKGSPYVGDNLKDYREQSPITYFSRIKTPTLILHDTGDNRVSITQSYALYRALKDNGVEVKFVAYPVSGHAPGDPIRQMDIYRRSVEWMDQHLK